MINTLANVNEWQTLTHMAKTFIDSGLLPQSIKKPEAALLIMWQGRELGIDPLQALNTINVIQGKPTVSPQLMLALIRRSGQLVNAEFKVDDKQAVVTLQRKGETPHTETFSMDDAKKLGLATKDNWQKQPKTMLKWRAVAAAARVVFPDVILGLYTPEEMGANVTVTDEGDMQIVDAPAEPALKALPPTANGHTNSPTMQVVEEELARDQGVSTFAEEEIIFANRVRLEKTADGKSWFAIFTARSDDNRTAEWHDLAALKAAFPQCKQWHEVASAAWKAGNHAEVQLVSLDHDARLVVNGNRVVSATKADIPF